MLERNRAPSRSSDWSPARNWSAARWRGRPALQPPWLGDPARAVARVISTAAGASSWLNGVG